MNKPQPRVPISELHQSMIMQHQGKWKCDYDTSWNDTLGEAAAKYVPVTHSGGRPAVDKWAKYEMPKKAKGSND